MTNYSRVPFNKPYFSGNEIKNIQEAVKLGKLSGNGNFTKKCHRFFEEKYGFKKAFLTTSCTDALEMAAILCDIQPGDEVIVPAYTFVSTANAFLLRGAKIVFADSCPNLPNIAPEEIERLITEKTKAVCIVHYAGISCDMDKIMPIIEKHSLILVEDAAQAIDSYYNNKPLGSFGHFATFSFHETKNISCGEGGMLVVNNEKHIKRAEIIWEKGTNRAAFWRGEIDKYTWQDVGSSFLPSELNAAFLYAQANNIDKIQDKRKALWELYQKELLLLTDIALPKIPDKTEQNGHLFYVTVKNEGERNSLLDYLNKNEINAIFHYLPLHQSPFFKKHNQPQNLPNAEVFGKTLIRLPLHYYLTTSEVKRVCRVLKEFYE